MMMKRTVGVNLGRHHHRNPNDTNINTQRRLLSLSSFKGKYKNSPNTAIHSSNYDTTTSTPTTTTATNSLTNTPSSSSSSYRAASPLQYIEEGGGEDDVVTLIMDKKKLQKDNVNLFNVTDSQYQTTQQPHAHRTNSKYNSSIGSHFSSLLSSIPSFSRNDSKTHMHSRSHRHIPIFEGTIQQSHSEHNLKINKTETQVEAAPAKSRLAYRNKNTNRNTNRNKKKRTFISNFNSGTRTFQDRVDEEEHLNFHQMNKNTQTETGTGHTTTNNNDINDKIGDFSNKKKSKSLNLFGRLSAARTKSTASGHNERTKSNTETETQRANNVNLTDETKFPKDGENKAQRFRQEHQKTPSHFNERAVTDNSTVQSKGEDIKCSKNWRRRSNGRTQSDTPQKPLSPTTMSSLNDVTSVDSLTYDYLRQRADIPSSSSLLPSTSSLSFSNEHRKRNMKSNELLARSSNTNNSSSGLSPSTGQQKSNGKSIDRYYNIKKQTQQEQKRSHSQHQNVHFHLPGEQRKSNCISFGEEGLHDEDTKANEKQQEERKQEIERRSCKSRKQNRMKTDFLPTDVILQSMGNGPSTIDFINDSTPSEDEEGCEEEEHSNHTNTKKTSNACEKSKLSYRRVQSEIIGTDTIDNQEEEEEENGNSQALPSSSTMTTTTTTTTSKPVISKLKDSNDESNIWRKVMYCMQLAETGDSKAQCDLGTHYERGMGIERDMKKAIHLYKSSARQGYSRAQFHLARCHAHGLGTAVDWHKAFKLYKKAARCGHVPSICNLGVCYHNGNGVPKDEEKAVSLYRDAAIKNYARAWYNLGVCYETAFGVQQDFTRAAALYKKAALGKFAQGICSLGACYENGIGLQQDVEKAVRLYRKAAKAGCARAVFYLGLCYESGKGVAGSIEEAISLYEKAAELGLQDAVLYLHRFHAHLHNFNLPTPPAKEARIPRDSH